MIQTTDNAKVTVKPLTQGQTLLNMLGYVQKDYGEAHVRLYHTPNIDAAVLRESRTAYNRVSTDYTTGKQKMARSNLDSLVYKFWSTVLYPLVVPVHRIIYYMIQSLSFVLTGSSWVSTPVGQPINFFKMQAFHNIVNNPRQVQMSDVLDVVFSTSLPGTSELSVDRQTGAANVQPGLDTPYDRCVVSTL